MAKVYIKINENNHVCEINSDIFLKDLTDYIFIDEGSGDKYAHAQGNYLEKNLVDERGRYNYKYENEELVEISDEEKDEIFVEPDPEPTAQEKINAELMLEIAKLKAGVA